MSLTWYLITACSDGISACQPLPALQPDTQKCTVIGQGLELAETAQQAHFEVHLVDMVGDPCTTEQQVTAVLMRSLVDRSVTPTSVAHKTPNINFMRLHHVCVRLAARLTHKVDMS